MLVELYKQKGQVIFQLFIENKGIYPADEIKSWETIKEMKDRIKKVLEKYTSYKKIQQFAMRKL